MSNDTDSSEFPSPGSPADDEAGLPASAHLTPMPAGMILFPRRMLYVEAVLYLLIAGASFAVGYLVARRGGSTGAGPAIEGSAADSKVPVEGSVMLEKSGQKRPDVGAVVIVLPGDKSPTPLPAARFRPGDSAPAGSDDAAMRDLTAFGGAMARVGADGSFQMSLPRPGTYRVLAISPQGTRPPSGALEKPDQKVLANYFDDPADLLQHSPYKLFRKDVRRGMDPIPLAFPE